MVLSFDLAIFCSGKLFQINGQRKESEQPHPIGKVLFSSWYTIIRFSCILLYCFIAISRDVAVRDHETRILGTIKGIIKVDLVFICPDLFVFDNQTKKQRARQRDWIEMDFVFVGQWTKRIQMTFKDISFVLFFRKQFKLSHQGQKGLPGFCFGWYGNISWLTRFQIPLLQNLVLPNCSNRKRDRYLDNLQFSRRLVVARHLRTE